MDPNYCGLARLHLRLDLADTPTTVLDLAHLLEPTATDIRKSYRALALILHPDKCYSNFLLSTHQRLFIKVQAAHDALLEQLEDEEQEREKNSPLPVPPVGPEYFKALQKRNIEFQEKQKVYKQHCLDIVREEEWRSAKWAWARQSALDFEKQNAQATSSNRPPVAEPEEWKLLPKHFQKVQRDARKVRLAESDKIHIKTELEEGHELLRKSDGGASTTKKDIKYTEAKNALKAAGVSVKEKERRQNNTIAQEFRDNLAIDHEFDKRAKAAIYASGRGFGYSFSECEQIDEETWQYIEADLDLILGGRRGQDYLAEVEAQGIVPLSAIMGGMEGGDAGEMGGEMDGDGEEARGRLRYRRED